MVASVTQNLFSSNFLLNQVLVCYSRTQIAGLCQILKISVSYFYVLILACMLVTREQQQQGFSAFTSRSVSLLVPINICVPDSSGKIQSANYVLENIYSDKVN
jgi:hypothetical protein